MLFKQCFETRETEHLTIRVMGLYYPIAVEEEALSGCQRCLLIGEVSRRAANGIGRRDVVHYHHVHAPVGV